MFHLYPTIFSQFASNFWHLVFDNHFLKLEKVQVQYNLFIE